MSCSYYILTIIIDAGDGGSSEQSCDSNMDSGLESYLTHWEGIRADERGERASTDRSSGGRQIWKELGRAIARMPQ